MSVTVILTSHMKPFLRDALASLDEQTRRDFSVILLDSGVWRGQTDEQSLAMAQVHRDTKRRFRWRFTDEPPRPPCPVGAVTNTAIRSGLVKGKYVCHFYDDDVYDPRFMERMAGYLDDHPDEMAVWCSQDRARIERDGGYRVFATIRAYDGLSPGQIDNRVDGGQVMYRRKVLDMLGDPWMTEDGALCMHSDGIFLERVASVIGHPIGAIPDVLMTHRMTPLSTYSPT